MALTLSDLDLDLDFELDRDFSVVCVTTKQKAVIEKFPASCFASLVG